MNVSYMILIMNFFRGIPTEIEDAAVIDGANQLQILFRVYLPMSMPSLATIILFATVANWNCWMDGYMYMNTPDKYPLQTYLATILMESKNNVETLMTPEQLIRMAKVSEKTIEAAQIFPGCTAHHVRVSLPAEVLHKGYRGWQREGLISCMYPLPNTPGAAAFATKPLPKQS